MDRTKGEVRGVTKSQSSFIDHFLNPIITTLLLIEHIESDIIIINCCLAPLIHEMQFEVLHTRRNKNLQNNKKR